MNNLSSRNLRGSTTRVADRLHSAAIRLLRALRIEDTKAGMGPARLSALSVLVFAGPQSLGSLARMEQVQPPTMSRIVAGMERDGLVKRNAAGNDRRRISLEATKKGTSLLQKARKRRIGLLASRLEKLQPQELATLGEAAELILNLPHQP
ncbi:MAG TPA: MarR family transcriptional regulator [Alphaproteobacteria bacterium]|nr:MarR family transcriptional regulator [Alphaproteobacteria bacterium]